MNKEDDPDEAIWLIVFEDRVGEESELGVILGESICKRATAEMYAMVLADTLQIIAKHYGVEAKDLAEILASEIQDPTEEDVLVPEITDTGPQVH